jgi:hypothetical protein
LNSRVQKWGLGLTPKYIFRHRATGGRRFGISGDAEEGSSIHVLTTQFPFKQFRNPQGSTGKGGFQLVLSVLMIPYLSSPVPTRVSISMFEAQMIAIFLAEFSQRPAKDRPDFFIHMGRGVRRSYLSSSSTLEFCERSDYGSFYGHAVDIDRYANCWHCRGASTDESARKRARKQGYVHTESISSLPRTRYCTQRLRIRKCSHRLTQARWSQPAGHDEFCIIDHTRPKSAVRPANADKAE